jgi:hypothetical protein
MTVRAQFDQYELIIRQQAAKIEELQAENERLRAGADAHTILQSVYRDPDAPQGNRIKAATAALNVEKPRLHSLVPTSEQDRRLRWHAYERFQLKMRVIEETRQLPKPDWDESVPDDYQAPEGDTEPPPFQCWFGADLSLDQVYSHTPIG